MKRLLCYMREYTKECILAPLFKLLEASFELLVPLVVAAIIDTGIGKGDKGYIGWMCLLMATLAVVGLAAALSAQYFAARAATGFAAKLRRALFQKVQSLSYSGLDRLGASSLLTRLTSDVNQVQTGVNLFLRLLLRSPFIVFGAMVMAFVVDATVAWIFVILIAALGAVVAGLMCLTMPRYRRNQQLLDRVTAATRENLSGVRVLRAFGKEEEEVAAFRENNRTLTRFQIAVGRLSALTNPATYVLVNAAVIWILYTGAIRVDGGLLSQGAVIALYNYLSQILVELMKLANLIVTLSRSAACATRIADTLDTPADQPAAPLATQNTDAHVSFCDVELTYPGAGAPSLSGVTFSAKRGETVGILGPTGSGKSS
ncbi:MAG: ABC transporter ATP-binding protein, partial [Clostridia bacterium]|nr:ABC transporter ATP-binding protein [Clostridia bacterium]